MTDVLGRLAGALAERYRLERELGAGGMATVYLAEDLRHHRRVAVKVLRPELAAVIGAERFLAEIRTTANLQHPHILPLFDSGTSDGFLYYVMPFVEGESLRDRLEREKQLPIADAVRIATEVAGALDYAHRHGVIHRDIKPENILLHDGTALVADFGIALAASKAGGTRMTETGMSLGTPHYMSPEQAMGEREISVRSDVYALGCVTYEMLVGDPPFTGSTAQAIVAKVVTEKPAPPSRMRDTVPPQVEDAVLTALAKLPADRFASAAEFAAALAAAPAVRATVRVARAAPAGVGPWRRVSAALGVLVLGLLALAAWALLRPRGAGGPALYDAALPDTAMMSLAPDIGSTGYGTPTVNLSVSPRGDFAVYPVRHGDSTMLWSRSLVDATARPIPGTAGGTTPRISPDGTRLAFTAGNRTLVVPVEGGEPRRLLEGAAPPSTLEWVSPTRLMAITTDGTVLKWLDAEVGADDQGTKLPTATRCLFAHWIARTRQILCTMGQGTLLDPATGATTPIRTRNADGSPGATVTGSAFQIVDDRYLIYLSLDGELRAAPYDGRAALVGRSVSLVAGIRRDAVGSGQMDVTPGGLLGYIPARSNADVQLVVLHAGGEAKPLPIERAYFQRFELTRDGRRLAAVVVTPEGNELRIYDLRTGQHQTWLRAEYIGGPLWDRAGERILVRVRNPGRTAIIRGSPSLATAPDTLMAAADPTRIPEPTDYHDDANVLARGVAPYALMRLDLTRQPVRADTFFPDAVFAAISPDGRHLVWQSQSQAQLDLSSYPPGAARQQIAVGGVEPLWLSSSELLYRAGLTWNVVRLDPATGALAGAPTRWGLDTRFLDTPGWSNRPAGDGGIVYVQSPDISDARFLRFMPDFVTRMEAAVDAANR